MKKRGREWMSERSRSGDLGEGGKATRDAMRGSGDA
jgi:hypothetical protein